MDDWRGRMNRSVRHLAEQLLGIRSGTIGVGFVETFRVNLAGKSATVGKIASVTRQGDRIVVSPFDPAHVSAIVRALVEAKMNAYALNPRSVAVGIPPISGEQRIEMAKHVKRLGEEAKIAIRSVRQDARKQIEARGRGSIRAVQEATDEAVAEIDRLLKAKVAELGA